MKAPAPEEVDRALRAVSRLHRLFQQLPRVLTPRSQALLDEFEGFRTGQRTALSLPAARVGMEAAFRAGRDAHIIAVRELAGAALPAVDRTLDTWVFLAKQRLGELPTPG